MRFLLVCLGGAIGTGLRYVTAGVAARWLGADFPYGTLIVNLSGAFVVGFVQEIGTRTLLVSDTSRVFLSIGVLGGLTTYSTFSFETVRLAEVGAWYRAWLNVVVTTAGCLALCVLGIVAARVLVGPRG